MFSESESEKEELNVNWFNQLFEQTKSDIQQSNEDFSTNETTSKNIVTTTANTSTSTTSTSMIATTTENKIEWPVWSFDWGDFGIGNSKKEKDILDDLFPTDNWLSDQSQSEEWISNQWIADDGSSIGPDSVLNTGWDLSPSIFSSNNWFSEDQFGQSIDRSDDSESIVFEWMSEDDSSSIPQTTDQTIQANLLGDNQSFFKSIWSNTITDLWTSDEDEGSTEIQPEIRIIMDDPGSGSGRGY